MQRIQYLRLSSLVVLFIFILSGKMIYGQSNLKYTISGYVYEKGSRETLIGVNIYDMRTKTGVVTNTYGYYAITLPADSVSLLYSYVGFNPHYEKLILKSNIRLDIEMEGSIELGEFVVRDEQIHRISQRTQMSQLEIPMLQAKAIPGLLGEKDMLKVLQLMPGVQSGTEGTSGFYVRGGGADQNLIILDDAPVYNASHLFGFFSVFNGDAVKNMQLYKGGFPARFGGRLSSVLDIQMKDGNKQEFHGEAGIGLISSRLMVEGPILKNKASFLISGRRTYIDALIRPFMPSDSKLGYFFYDLNAKINYDINPNNKLFVSGYFGKDKFSIYDKYGDDYHITENDIGFFWQNATSTIRWNHIFNNQLFSNLSVYLSDYTLKLGEEVSEKNTIEDTKYKFESSFNSGIRDVGLKYDVSWLPLPNHIVRMGLSSVYHLFTPSAVVLRNDEINVNDREVEQYHSFESGLYIEDEMKIGDWLSLNPGLRLSHFYANKRSYQHIEPRLSVNVKMTPQLSWKSSYASMNQYVHLLSTTGIGLPTDLWVPSTDKIPPQQTWQVATGLAYDWLAPNVEVSIEGYYKKADHVMGYKEGASFLFMDDPINSEKADWENKVTSGQGWSYGVEFLLHCKQGRFSGWIGYTLSWTQLQFDSLNYGKKFWARYDRRHDISLVGMYEVSPGISLSLTWVYGTGNAMDLGIASFPVEQYSPVIVEENPNAFFYRGANVYGEKNSFRAEPYHRLDAAIQFNKEMKAFGRTIKRTIELGVYNAYSRRNPFFYYWRENYNYFDDGVIAGSSQSLMKVSIFRLIPSISFNYKF